MTTLNLRQTNETSKTESPLLSVKDLSVSFSTEAGVVQAVRSLSYDIMPGESLAIVGESGSGKSVSSLAVMGLLPPSAKVTGSITFDGIDLLGRSDVQLSKLRGKRISMVFQDPLSALTPVYTIGEQIAETVLVHQKMSKVDAMKRAIQLLELVGISNAEVRARAYPHEFSGGMRQRVMIAIAIANDPELIICDEPTTALDVTIQAQVMELLAEAREITNAATVLITHDLGVVSGFSDRVMVMYAGKAVELGGIDDIFYQPHMPYTMGLLRASPRVDAVEKQPLIAIEGTPPSVINLPPGCPFAPRCPAAVDACSHSEPSLEPVSSRHLSACHRNAEGLTPESVFKPKVVEASALNQQPRQDRDTVLELEGLEKIYALKKGALVRKTVGEVRAVDGLTFDIKRGETFALVGESGCGKSTTILEIMNLVKPSAGKIVVFGKDTATLSRAERHAARQDISMVFQDPLSSLDPRMPVGDILKEPMQVHGYSAQKQNERVRELLVTVGLLPEHANRFPAAFSGGQKQRIGIARALATEPKLIVLDEPVSALDVSIQAGVINLLDELKQNFGVSYLFVSHDLSVVRHLADRVAVMYLGKIVEVGETKAVFANPSHPYTSALLSAIPVADPNAERSRKRIILTGDLPSPTHVPKGCRFSSRCFVYRDLLQPEQRAKCDGEHPGLSTIVQAADHASACYHQEVLHSIDQ